MSTVKERLQYFLKKEGISASEFSRKMNLSPTYIASMRKSMPEEKVEKLVSVFPQLNRNWLLFGRGEMYIDTGDPAIDPHRLDKHIVPLVPTQTRAGSFDEYVQGITEFECEKVYSPSEYAQLAIRVRGDSMEPKIHDGALLFLQRINEKAFIPWGSPLVLDTDNGSLVKMLYPGEKDDSYLIAKSYNPDYPPFAIPTETIKGIYRIICSVMEGVTF